MPDGTTQFGEWTLGKLNGLGMERQVSTNAISVPHEYIGNFKASQFEGKGRITYPGNPARSFEGTWKDGKPVGPFYYVEAGKPRVELNFQTVNGLSTAINGSESFVWRPSSVSFDKE